MGIVGSEFEALRIIESQGGETNIDDVSKKMGIELNNARELCLSIAREDYIDYLISGDLLITPKGQLEVLMRRNRPNNVDQ